MLVTYKTLLSTSGLIRFVVDHEDQNKDADLRLVAYGPKRPAITALSTT